MFYEGTHGKVTGPECKAIWDTLDPAICEASHLSYYSFTVW